AARGEADRLPGRIGLVAEEEGGVHWRSPSRSGGEGDGARRRDGVLVAFEDGALGQDERRLDCAGVMDDDADDPRVAGPAPDLAMADDGAVHRADEDAVAALEEGVMHLVQLDA